MNIGRSERECLWFGTVEKADWFQTPNTGASTDPSGWVDEGTLVSGGGYLYGSWDSHKTYIFEWPRVEPAIAQRLKSFADGTYGRGLLYFHLPNTFDTNVLPARWADPSMALDFESPSLARGVTPVAVTTPANTLDLPVRSAQYTVTSLPSGFRGEQEAVYIPIPEGHTLWLGGKYTRTGTGGVFATQQLANGNKGTDTLITPSTHTESTVVTNSFTGIPGVWLWVGKSGAGAATVVLRGLVGRIRKNGGTISPLFSEGPWIGGQGHSGTRISGKPTYIEHSPGKVSFAATFKEVGDWVAL